MMLVAVAFFAAPLLSAADENWVEVRTPHFVVVSDAGENQARKTAVHFEEVRAVFRESLAVLSNYPSPVIIVLALKDEDSFRALMPQFWLKEHPHPTGYFAMRGNQSFAAIVLSAEGTNPYEVVYHAYYHTLMLPFFPKLPLWITEGLADFFANSEIEDKEVVLGRSSSALIAALKSWHILALQALFEVDRESPDYTEEHEKNIFFGQAWAFAHYLMVGDHGSHKQVLENYLKLIGQDATQEEATAKAFGDLKQLGDAFTRYSERLPLPDIKMPAPDTISETDMKVRKLSEAEADAYRGGFEMVSGSTQDAKSLLEEALELDPKLALAFQYKAWAEFFDGRTAKALASASQSLVLEPKNAIVLYLRAYLNYRGAGGAAEHHEVEDDLRHAIAVSPDFAAPYSLLAIYMAAHNEYLPEALSLSQKAISLEPGNADYRLSLAHVLLRMTKYDEAQKAGQGALAVAKNRSERVRPDLFLTYLEQLQLDQAQPEGRAADSLPPYSDSAMGSGREQQIGIAGGAGEIELREATGDVTNTDCESGGSKIEIKTDLGTIHLHIAPGDNVEIKTPSRPPPTFNSCTWEKNSRVTVKYEPYDVRGQTGWLKYFRIITMPPNPPRLIYRADAPVGQVVRAEGFVADVVCKSNHMDVVVMMGDIPVPLHRENYSKVLVVDDAGFQPDRFDVCTQLKGRKAVFAFVVAEKDKAYHGDILSIDLEK
jgi:tetratricopeptide (TPR) repeat protein